MWAAGPDPITVWQRSQRTIQGGGLHAALPARWRQGKGGARPREGHVLTTLLCMARVPRAEVFLVFLKEIAEAATESPAALERKVREKANENSLAVWRGLRRDGGVNRRGVGGGRKCGPSYARRLRLSGLAVGNVPRKWFDCGTGRRVGVTVSVAACGRVEILPGSLWLSDCKFGTIFRMSPKGAGTGPGLGEIRRVHGVRLVATPLLSIINHTWDPGTRLVEGSVTNRPPIPPSRIRYVQVPQLRPSATDEPAVPRKGASGGDRCCVRRNKSIILSDLIRRTLMPLRPRYEVIAAHRRSGPRCHPACQTAPPGLRCRA